MGSEVKPSERNRANRIHALFQFYRAATWIREEGTEDAEIRSESCEAAIKPIEVGVMGKRNVGSDFDDFLKEDDLLEEATAVAIKRVIAHQLLTLMKKQRLTKAEMARRMETSRAALDRLLDPDNPSVTLQTLQSAAAAVGGRLRIKLEIIDAAA
jgi:hypothetical protein